MRAILLAALVALASPAVAQAPAGSSLTLVDASTAPVARTIIDGASWSCQPTGTCVATGGQDQPALRACRRVVAKMGEVSSFSWKGNTLSAEQIAACNAA